MQPRNGQFVAVDYVTMGVSRSEVLRACLREGATREPRNGNAVEVRSGKFVAVDHVMVGLSREPLEPALADVFIALIRREESHAAA